jgi:uncharacterized protein involved in response to NO
MPKRISLSLATTEPYRFFFPQAVLAGLLGVSLWPLYFLHLTEFYPGLAHIRIMTLGFFGGFIFGFLGTAMPRMLSAQQFRPWETAVLLGLHAAMVLGYAAQKLFLGDTISLLLLLVFAACVARRAASRKDTPPPGFVLVGLAFLSVTVGTALAIAQNFYELPAVWINLQRLLSSQGFVLLPILGIGPFILPRFFGMESAHDFPETLAPPAMWWRKAGLAVTAGALILGSFFLEASGRERAAYALRFGVTLVYLLLEFPLYRAPKLGNVFGLALRVALLMVLTGFLCVFFFPQLRVSLLHLTLVGGFALITFVVATRVFFGHSGQLDLLKKANRWFLVALGLMLFGMATRISGDLWPKIMVSHYVYGSVLWATGVLIWSWRVLPKVLWSE